jgi:uncharacterized protein (TIGR00251 family)
MLQENSGKIFFLVKITPKSSKNEIIGWFDNILKIKIKEIPEKQKANKELISFLSKIFKVPKSSITIAKGTTSKIKKITIDNLSILKAQKSLNPLL